MNYLTSVTKCVIKRDKAVLLAPRKKGGRERKEEHQVSPEGT